MTLPRCRGSEILEIAQKNNGLVNAPQSALPPSMAVLRQQIEESQRIQHFIFVTYSFTRLPWQTLPSALPSGANRLYILPLPDSTAALPSSIG